MKITIIGAGMAGLLAANMLRRYDVTVIEAKPSLPTNHRALLRFRSPAVSDATGIPFQRVTVRKGVWDGEQVVTKPTFVHANAYSLNVTSGELHDRSITNLTKTSDRWIAPEDFVAQLAQGINIRFGEEACVGETGEGNEWPIISTIPMPAMMNNLGYKGNAEDGTNFNFRPIWTIRARIKTPKSFVNQTIYNSSNGDRIWYRATLQGADFILECTAQPNPNCVNEIVDRVIGYFIGSSKFLVFECSHEISMTKFGKIIPIDERVRRSFIMHLTDAYSIYSLGRFACWRHTLLDDVVIDVKRIEAMINKTQDGYARRLEYTAKNESHPY